MVVVIWAKLRAWANVRVRVVRILYPCLRKRRLAKYFSRVYDVLVKECCVCLSCPMSGRGSLAKQLMVGWKFEVDKVVVSEGFRPAAPNVPY